MALKSPRNIKEHRHRERPESTRYRTRPLNRSIVTASEARQSMQSGSHGLLHFVRYDDVFSR